MIDQAIPNDTIDLRVNRSNLQDVGDSAYESNHSLKCPQTVTQNQMVQLKLLKTKYGLTN